MVSLPHHNEVKCGARRRCATGKNVQATFLGADETRDDEAGLVFVDGTHRHAVRAVRGLVVAAIVRRVVAALLGTLVAIIGLSNTTPLGLVLLAGNRDNVDLLGFLRCHRMPPSSEG
jgi:hypothetical protein